MKKLLLSALMLSALAVNAQVLVSENFNTMTPGNLGTDVTGATAGQNSWYTLNGNNLAYQITTIDAAHGQSLNITGYGSFDTGTTSTQNTRIAAKLTTVTPTAGNNILNAQFELFTGAYGGAGQIQFRIWGMDGTNSRTLGGFLLNSATGELRGLGTVNNTSGTGTAGPVTYSYGLATTPGVLLPANTWVTLTFRYDMTTGALSWYFPGGSGAISGGTGYTLIPGMIAEDTYLYNVATTGNTFSKTAGFDNILVEFTNAAALNTTEISVDNMQLNVYPNPVSEILYIGTKDKIKSVEVYDMSGRKIDVRFENNEVDVRHLQTGNYVISIETAKGKVSEKFIKK